MSSLPLNRLLPPPASSSPPPSRRPILPSRLSSTPPPSLIPTASTSLSPGRHSRSKLRTPPPGHQEGPVAYGCRPCPCVPASRLPLSSPHLDTTFSRWPCPPQDAASRPPRTHLQATVLPSSSPPSPPLADASILSGGGLLGRQSQGGCWRRRQGGGGRRWRGRGAAVAARLGRGRGWGTRGRDSRAVAASHELSMARRACRRRLGRRRRT
ncbi:hypothetical protein BS78_09G126500 [Paspalum vaginatum]|nr:hypothetical protein BS78_09G126500 [Paspalum vaginatum]